MKQLHKKELEKIMEYINERVEYKNNWEESLVRCKIHSALCKISVKEYKAGSDMASSIWNPKTEEI